MNPDEPLSALTAALRAGRASSVELTRHALTRAREVRALNAFVRLHQRTALARATEADAAARAGRATGLLHGLPVAVKDNLDEAGVRCAAGCRAYRNRRPARDAAVVTLLRQAGAVLVGRTGMHELADGVTSVNPWTGPIHNPWRHGFHPGGSSGGSAVAVATGCVRVALGTDTGGSVRIPASLCGVVGLKPTAGRLPGAGAMPLSTTLDHVGVLGRTVADVLHAMRALGALPLAPAAPLPRLRLGLLRGFALDADPDVELRLQAAVRLLGELGHTVELVTVPGLRRGLALLSALYAPEAAAVHARILSERPDDIGEEVRADLQRGAAADPARHARALEERGRLTAELDALRDRFDAFLSPTTPHPARPFDAPDPHTYLTFTSPFNVTGQPAVSVPMGRIDDLPIGLQLVGHRGDDARILGLAAEHETHAGSTP